MLPPTATRVKENTDERINLRIRHATECSVLHYATSGPEAIDRRLAQLDKEWDIERCVETMAPTISLLGLALGVTKNRKWLLVPAVVQSFFLQHALQGWCPPIPVLRRLGFRTMKEIDEERYALKALRGDFANVPTTTDEAGDGRAMEALHAVRS